MMSRIGLLGLSGRFHTLSGCGSGSPRLSALTTPITPIASSFHSSKLQGKHVLDRYSMQHLVSSIMRD
ncbi:uncharacterized protein CTRU02_204300 [Colletotrichum truncatum]|uniref:Uncharacterized protein n=1 Tax=Colletotrichum truncatum TaxID=5467 RepID=A0ACC3ZBN6_COLTU